MKHKKTAISLWVGFGLLSLLIIGEASTPSSISGQQSNWLANILSGWINQITPSKAVEPIYPTDLQMVPNAFLCEENQAILGTTKVVDYVLSFPDNPGSAPKQRDVTITRTDGSNESDYSVTITPNSSGGRIRIQPFRCASFSFSLSDQSGHNEAFDFEVVPLLEPETFHVTFPSSMKIGESFLVEGAISQEGIEDKEGESADHYLRRFYDPLRYSLVSSDPSVIETGNGYLRALSPGNATLSHEGKPLATITVTNESMPKGTISLQTPATNVLHLLDYDYQETHAYGVPLSVDFSSEDMDQTILWESSNPLVARVSNTHFNNKGELVPGGFVTGYRITGEATITGTLLSNPSSQVQIQVRCEEQPPSDAKFSFLSSGVTHDGSSTIPLSSGNTMAIKTTFLPLNASKTAIHVESSHPEVALILNNDSSSVSVIAKNVGTSHLVCYFLANPSLRIEIDVSVEGNATINDGNIGKFQIATRKFIGHFTLFALTGLVGFLASFFTFFEGKKFALPLNAGIGFLLSSFLAVVSEAIQKIPSLHRGGSWTDVLIDCSGAFVGVLLGALICLLIFVLRKKKKRD
ncbi:MAG: hypothetical protein SOV58_05470 [Candidatus Enteromonas sp.]|nr:hypothetical protein [Candidatus Enteromonas sp.]